MVTVDHQVYGRVRVRVTSLRSNSGNGNVVSPQRTRNGQVLPRGTGIGFRFSEVR